MVRRELKRKERSKRLPEHRQMIDHVLLVDIPPYSLVISATNYKFTQHYDKPFSLFHTVKRSNVNKSVGSMCFHNDFKRMAFAEILRGVLTKMS